MFSGINGKRAVMRICLVFPPRSSPTYTPLGIACLAASARQAGAPVELFDANLELWNSFCDTNAELAAMREFSHGSLADFRTPARYIERWGHIVDGHARFDELEKLCRQYLAGAGLDSRLAAVLRRQAARVECGTPEAVGFSVMYLDQLPFALALAKYLAASGAGCRLFLGGAAMSALSPAELLAGAPFLDAILEGEGEVPFRGLLAGADWAALPGCYFRENGRVTRSGAPESVRDLGELPIPDFRQLAGNGYFNPLPVLPIYGCRGCKWRRCRFCTHNGSFGRFRARPPMLVAQEMLSRRISCGCRHFYLVDQYVDPVYLDALCDAILDLGLDCRFQIMARTIEEYTPGLLEKAARAGCCWISWGMESGSQRLLDLMNKGTRVGPAEQVIREASAAGISNLLMMIFGAPGANRESMEETFSFLERVWGAIDGMTASAFVLFDRTAFGRNPGGYGLEVLGGNRILDLEGKPIYDLKLRFRRTGEPGRMESPLAAMEIAEWERRKIWLPELPFYGKLCCEHYLLYAGDRPQTGSRPNPGKLRSA